MRKYIKFNILGLMLIVMALVSCDQASQDASPIVDPSGAPLPTFVTEFNATNVNEGDTIIYNISLNKQLDRSVTFSARVIGGTASDEDFVVTPATVKPYSNNATLTIVVDQDYAADDAETVNLEIGVFGIADNFLVNENTVNPVLNFSINNFVDDTLEMVFEWDKDIFVNAGYEDYPDYGWEESAYDYVDYDIWLADATDFDINDPWATYMGYLAGTGDTPETAVLTLTDLPVGSYVIMANLWYNGFVEDFAATEVVSHEPIPVTATFKRQGVFEATVNQHFSQVLSSATPGDDNADYVGDRTDTFVAGLEITATEFVVTDYEGTEVVRGKVADIERYISNRPANLKK
jgi:hypothetical protein